MPRKEEIRARANDRIRNGRDDPNDSINGYWWERTVRNLEGAMSDDRLRHRLQSVFRRLLQGGLMDVITSTVAADVSEQIADERILLSRRGPAGFDVVSFAASNPDWQRQFALWVLDLCAEDIAEMIQRSKQRPRRAAARD